MNQQTLCFNNQTEIIKPGNGQNRAFLKLRNYRGRFLKPEQKLNMTEKLLTFTAVCKVSSASQTFAAEAGGAAEQCKGVVRRQWGLAQRRDESITWRHHAQAATKPRKAQHGLQDALCRRLVCAAGMGRGRERGTEREGDRKQERGRERERQIDRYSLSIPMEIQVLKCTFNQQLVHKKSKESIWIVKIEREQNNEDKDLR